MELIGNERINSDEQEEHKIDSVKPTPEDIEKAILEQNRLK